MNNPANLTVCWDVVALLAVMLGRIVHNLGLVGEKRRISTVDYVKLASLPKPFWMLLADPSVGQVFTQIVSHDSLSHLTGAAETGVSQPTQPYATAVDDFVIRTSLQPMCAVIRWAFISSAVLSGYHLVGSTFIFPFLLTLETSREFRIHAKLVRTTSFQHVKRSKCQNFVERLLVHCKQQLWIYPFFLSTVFTNGWCDRTTK